jgi:hypothetical protein
MCVADTELKSITRDKPGQHLHRQPALHDHMETWKNQNNITHMQHRHVLTKSIASVIFH